MHEGHGALHLQHLHHHAVTLRRHALVQAQAQCGVLALEGGTGHEQGVAEGSGALQQQRVPSDRHLTGQGWGTHLGSLSGPLDLLLPRRAQGMPGGRAGWQGQGCGGWSRLGGRAHLVAEALLEAHRDAIEQAPPWSLGQLSLTVRQVGSHTVGPFVYFPGLEEGEMDTRQSEIGLFFFFFLNCG